MRISKRFKLSLMAVLAGLVIHSGLVSAATKEEEIAERINKTHADTTEEKVIQLIVRRIESDCITLYPGDLAAQAKCVKDIFKALCPEIKKKGDEKKRKYLMGCPVISKRLKEAGYDIPWACANKENGDQLCLISPTRVSSGDLLPISIEIGDLNDGTVDNVMVTVHVSTAFGTLTQPYRDPENPGDFELTWTGGLDGWVGTASLGSISGTVSAQPVFAIGNVPADDSVTITGHVDYTRDGFSESLDVSQMGEVLSETAVTSEELANEREVQIEQSDLDLSLSSNAENDLDSGDIDNGEANGGEVSLVVEQPGEPEDCHVHNSIYDSCPIEGIPLN